MKISILAFLFLVFSAVYPLDEPQAPVDPNVDDVTVEIPALSTPSNDNKSGSLFLIQARLEVSGADDIEGSAALSNHLTLSITNKSGGAETVQEISLFSISRIEIVKWAPEKVKDNLYLFKPVQYLIFTNQSQSLLSEERAVTYNGNIESLNNFIISGNFPKKMVYTIFYDQWIPGSRNFYRWENSRATVFAYNFDHPLKGVVKTIRFSY